MEQRFPLPQSLTEQTFYSDRYKNSGACVSLSRDLYIDR
jgi:hypothetical protein